MFMAEFTSSLDQPNAKLETQSRRSSVRQRLMILVSCSVLLATLPVATLFGIQEANRAAAARWSEMKTAADVLASISSEAVQANDGARAFQAIRAVSKSPGVVYARVRTALGGTLAENGAGVRLRHDVRINADQPNPSTWDLIATKSIEVTAAITFDGAKIGEVVVVHQANGIAGQILRSMSGVLGLAMMAMMLALVIAHRVQAAMTRPLANLTKSVASIAGDNDFSRRVRVESNDEVGDLVAGFNSMLEAIQARDARIDDQMRGLEADVAARTKDYLKARDEAQDANAAKSDFLATMSHEIRTPMNGVMVMAELLNAEDLSGKARRYADTIAKSGRSLLAVINDILDFSKIEAGKMDVEICPVDVVELIDDTLQLFAAKAREKGIELVAFVHPEAPRIVPADPVRLGQVLTNLTSNALKFTQQGHVIVRLEPDTSANAWRLVVLDSGVGIAQDKLGSIFGAFSQEDQTTTRRFGGTGLGLSISKKLTEAMGGAIAVTSKLGKGSAFHVRLPTLQTDDPLARSAAPPTLANNSPALTAFVGLQTPVEKAAITKRLRSAGLNIFESPDANVGLIIVDKTHRAQAMSLGNGSRLILLIEVGDTEAETLIAGGYAAALLERPFRHDQLDAILYRLSRGEPLTEPVATQVGATHAQYVYPNARVLVVDDSEVNREIALEALKRFDIEAATANDGQDALDILATTAFDLVLMDGSMPVLDGFEATKRLRARELEQGLAATQVVALTAFVVGPAAEAWRTCGMNGVLHKPFSLAALSDVLAQNLSADLAQRPNRIPQAFDASIDHNTTTPSLEVSPTTSDLFDEAVLGPLLKSLHKGRADFVNRVIGLYREHGVKASAEMQTAFDRDDQEDLAKAAHALKSMSLNLGAKAVAQKAAAIENAIRGDTPSHVNQIDLDTIAYSLELTLSGLDNRVSQQANNGDPAKDTIKPDTRMNLPRLQVQNDLDDTLAKELAADLDAGALDMMYQPLFDKTGTTIVSAEALVRWKRGDKAPIGPDIFVPLAERCGLICQLGTIARQITFQRTANWGVPIAVNVSPLELVDEHFVDNLDTLMAKTGFASSNLVLEVTETAFIGEPERILALFKTLKERGISLSLDDFGSGYSSLTSLHRFPFDKIKIDREFVSALDGGARSALEALAIIQAVTGIGRVLGREVIAEGVETASQHLALKSAGVHTMQGYLFSKPVGPSELEALLAAQSSSQRCA
jgi:signal transduction histidine kinase/EAL domain-containing protein (putative c-di-GMP-specific phosphodiesterase class I)/DNA-binding NarL/FixJ family response regulator/HPt (histidine-containing phosphotransfer) domain-containing protein